VGHAATLNIAENVTHANTLSGIVIVVFREETADRKSGYHMII
jgi:hypothetical protein